MLSVELVEKILNSTWCTLPSEWDWTLRSNSYLKLLDLTHPTTYGIHVAYNLLTNKVCYVLIVVPEETVIELEDYKNISDDFKVSVYEENMSQHVVFYRKELDKNVDKCI